MAVEVGMPKFGFSMEEGVIAAWLVKVGDTVKKGDPIAEINSEKLTNNANATADGVIAKLLMQEGDAAPCGTPICLIAAPGETVEDTPAAAPAATAEPAAAASGGEVKITPRAEKLAKERGIDYSRIKGTGIGGAITIDDLRNAPASPVVLTPQAEVKITPRAKKIAQERGLCYDHIIGTGIGGMITVEDLKQYGKPVQPAVPAPMPAAAPAAAIPGPAAGETVKMTQMQQAVYRSMMASVQNSAQSTLHVEADVAQLKKLYQSLKGKYQAAGFKLSYTAMLIKAVAMALEEHTAIRTQLMDETHITVVPNIDLGIAVDVPGGLIVPVIRQANLKDLRTICAELQDLSARARAGRLTGEELGGAAMSITNLGMFGVKHFTPVLNLPESAILGVGAMVDQPVVKDGGIFVHPVMGMSLTYDHRVINGAPAARFLQAVTASLDQFQWI